MIDTFIIKHVKFELAGSCAMSAPTTEKKRDFILFYLYRRKEGEITSKTLEKASVIR